VNGVKGSAVLRFTKTPSGPVRTPSGPVSSFLQIITDQGVELGRLLEVRRVPAGGQLCSAKTVLAGGWR
jgi:hypothetical protein